MEPSGPYLPGRSGERGILLRRRGGADVLGLWTWLRGCGWPAAEVSLFLKIFSDQFRASLSRARDQPSRLEAGLPPPGIVARAMHHVMMPATEWDRELIADLAAERTPLREAEMRSIRRLAAAYEASLLGDKPQLLATAIPTREDALVDALRLTNLSACGSGNYLRPRALMNQFEGA